MLCTHKTTILCQFGLIICHQLTEPYLNQFSSIFGGNCIKYSKYMTTSSKGASEKRKITHYLTNTMLDNQFRGTTQQFVLHFNEQFRRLYDLTDISESMPESIKMALLQNAVKDIPQLSIVETLDEYTSTTCGNGSSTHLKYSS